MRESEKNIEGKFLKIICPKCSKIGTVFGKSSTLVKCATSFQQEIATIVAFDEGR